MQIDSVTYQQLIIAKWTAGDSLINAELTASTKAASDHQDVIEIQEYEVVPSKSLVPIEKDSFRELKFLHTGLSSNVSLIHTHVAEMYQKHAVASPVNNGRQIDIFI
jgi:hypothetical protein